MDDRSASGGREPVRFLVLCASLRADSLNGRLASLAAATIEANGGIIDPTAMPAFETPSYKKDVQDNEAFPPGAERLRDCIVKGCGWNRDTQSTCSRSPKRTRPSMTMGGSPTQKLQERLESIIGFMDLAEPPSTTRA